MTTESYPMPSINSNTNPKTVQESRLPSFKVAMKEAKEARGLSETVSKTIAINVVVLESIPSLIFLTLLRLFNLEIVIVGSIHICECPAQKYIPIYMIVAGSVNIIYTIGDWYYRWYQFAKSPPPTIEEMRKKHPLSCLFAIFNFCWLICGTVWMAKTHPTFHFINENSTISSGSAIEQILLNNSISNHTHFAIDENYCDQLTFVSGLIYVISCWLFVPIAILIACCTSCFLEQRSDS